MNSGRIKIVLFAALLVLSVAAGAHHPATAVTYVLLDGESFLETHVSDTVVVTADCAQSGNRLTAEVFLDLNDNGSLDGSEMRIHFAYLHDGIPTLENEEGDRIPGDDDARVDGLMVHYLELQEENYSFATVPMQFVIRVTDEDRSTAQAVLRVLPPVAQRPYIGGTVTELSTSAPLDSMVVVAYETSTEDIRATISDADGRYMLNVDAGQWQVFAYDLENYYAPGDSQTVTVAAQDSAVLDLALDPYAAYITGKVTSGGEPMPGIMVTAIEESFAAWFSWTQADGRYRIGVAPGVYALYALFLPEGYAAFPNSHLNVVVDSGTTIENKNFNLLVPSSRIQGRVTYQTGGGASEVTVRVFSAGFTATTRTDEDGDFSLAVLPGIYGLSAEPEGYEVLSPVTGFYYPIAIEYNQTIGGNDFIIAPAGGAPASISGRVTYRDGGQPAESVYVVIYNDEENSSLGWDFTATDAAGTYRFGDILGGTWLVGVYQPGYESDPSLRQAAVSLGTSADDQDFELIIGTAVSERDHSRQPSAFALLPNRPNPFNDETLIAYRLASGKQQPVTLRIFNVTGQEVGTLVDGFQGAGFHVVRWDGRSADGAPVSTGIYFLELCAGSRRQVQKMVLLR